MEPSHANPLAAPDFNRRADASLRFTSLACAERGGDGSWTMRSMKENERDVPNDTEAL
jgi:hypothetical protein